ATLGTSCASWGSGSRPRHPRAGPGRGRGPRCRMPDVMDIQSYMVGIGRQARAASREMARADTAAKNTVLLAIARAIRESADALAEANERDVKAARARKLDAAAID